MSGDPNYISADDFKSYLAKHGITDCEEKGDEISFPCPFSGCDDDRRRGEEYHCSFNTDKCVYQCFKCGEKGNFVTMQKHFGDWRSRNPVKKKRESLDKMAERCHKNLPKEYRDYFNVRGINNESIDKYMLGYGTFYGKQWLTIPVQNKEGKVAYLKLRRLPEDDGKDGTKYIVYPRKSELILCGIRELIDSSANDVLICEGELDRIIALQNGVKIPVITAGGANTFKDEWFNMLKDMRNIYICMDADKTGDQACASLVERTVAHVPNATIYRISLPYEIGVGNDITDYFMMKVGTAEELFSNYSEVYGGVEPIDESKFREMGVEDIADILTLTIKYDKVSKVITFLAMLLAYTDADQLNVMFNAASSTGKSYICNEVSKLFPANDVKMYGKASPTAFYYNESLMRQDPDTGQSYIDLERKILIFTEQPNTQLLENLRAFLSHDSKRTPYAITNKGKNGANKATEGYILGFASTFFCTANMRIDEQEQTRSLILSPESTVDKVKSSITASVIKGRNRAEHEARIGGNGDRRMLKDRISYIKRLGIKDIDIGEDDSGYLMTRFLENQKALSPRSQRDIVHFMSLVKGMALVNAMFRKNNGRIVAIKRDIDEAMKLWVALNESMQFGVSPQVLSVYKEHILPAYYKVNENAGTDKRNWRGITFTEFSQQYFSQTGTFPNMDMYRKMYISALECASLISYERSEDDKRKMIITPLVFFD